MIDPQAPILVTGAAGYLGSWIVDCLLRSGHRVHGTVRSLKDDARILHLQALAERYPDHLRLFEADLLQEGSFDEAMTDCEAVIHVASPYFVKVPADARRELMQPAVDGTLNVLRSANRVPSVRRVVLTSSVATLYSDACDVGPHAEHTVREEGHNATSDPRHNPYAHSKTLAEQAARSLWRQQHRWSLVTLHPGAIFGPSQSRRTDATSVGMMLQFLNGSFRSGVPRLWLGLVDVRDVALAHVRAATAPTLHDRYIIVGNSLRLLEMAQLLRVHEAGLPNRLPRREAPKLLMWLLGPLAGMQRRYVYRNVNHRLNFDNRRSRADLGLRYRPPAETLNDHLSQLVADGLLVAG